MAESSSGSEGSRSASPAVLAALKELQAEYGKVLPGYIEQLAKDVRRAKEAPGDSGPLEALRVQAHKLRGTAGSYGFRAVSQAAARLEDAVVRALEEQGDERWGPIEAAMAEIEAVMADGAESISGTR